MEQVVFHNKIPICIVPLMYREVIKERPADYLYTTVQKRIEDDRAAIDGFLGEIRPFCYHAHFARIGAAPSGPGEPFLPNGWFEGGDARSAYGITAARRPGRIIEIGSGNSTMFIKRAMRDFSLATQLTSIDPAPRAEIDRLCNTVIRRSVLDVDLAVFDQLKSGDILFHDGSHLTFNGTDTVRLFLEILPRLKPGVIIHLHDICLPYEYVSGYDGRGYSEQYMLATLLLASRQYEVILPVSYLGRQGSFDGGVSFWIRKRE